MEIRTFQARDRHGVIALWRQCGLVTPANNPDQDIGRKLQVGSGLFLVGVVAGTVVASVMGGYEGHRGWINYLAVHPSLRKKGYGRQIVEAVEALLLAAGCPKINLQVRTSNTGVLKFYQSLGYLQDDVVSLGKRLAD